jgi:pyridoxal phosphate enzyme (YggS family)
VVNDDDRTRQRRCVCAARPGWRAAAATEADRDPAGLTDFGENREAEARAKAAARPDLRWHFIGQLQRNKARSVAGFADCVHSVDRSALVTSLQKAAADRQRHLDVLVQVDLDPDPAPDRGGVRPDRLPELAAQIEAAPNLRLRGLMAVAPLGEDPDTAYDRLAGIVADFRARYPGADMVSAGMSGDLESAVRHGATHLRIGTALLGGRPAIVR